MLNDTKETVGTIQSVAPADASKASQPEAVSNNAADASVKDTNTSSDSLQRDKNRVVILRTASPDGTHTHECCCTPEQMKLCMNHQDFERPVGCPGTDSPDCPIHVSDNENQVSGSCCSAAKEKEEPKELKGTYKRLVILAGVASVATAIILIVMKFGVWLVSGSSSILASLTDSLIDLSASFINLLALRYALSPADDKHRFGHYKAEALASLSQAAFIGGSALLLIFNGFDRTINPVQIGYIDIAIYVSIASIVITIMLTMFQGYVCKVTKSEAIEADRFHYLSDVGLNLSVILSLVLSKMGYDWADGVVTILLGLYIMHSSYHIGHTAIGTLLDKSLSVEDHSKIIRAILSVEGIDSFHDLRTRKAGPQIYIQCHIVLDRTMSFQRAHDIADEAEHNIRRFFEDADITLHMEPDQAATFKDITFIDSQFCQVPRGYYNSDADKHKESASVKSDTDEQHEDSTSAAVKA